MSRLKQVYYYLRPRYSVAAQTFAAERLTPAQLAIFDSMGVSDRAHAVRVARRLEAEHAPAWVLEAALLHDCGKPEGYGLFWRVAGVLAESLLGDMPAEPRLTGARGWLQVYRWHDDYGRAAAQAAGTSAEALALLTAYGKQAGPQPWLEPLMKADDAG